MGNFSFVQTSFLNGEWSPLAQGRMTDPAYKSAMNVSYNAHPLEAGSHTKRSGARYLAHTKAGAAAALHGFDFSVTQPYQMEFTDGWLRFFAGLSLLTNVLYDGTVIVDRILPTNPVTVVLATAVPAAWANGQTVVFRLPSVPVTCPLLLGRQFVIANLDTVALTFTLKDPITGLDIDGTSFVYTTAPAGSDPDTVERVFELATPYTGIKWNRVRTVQDETTVLLLHNNVSPRTVSEGTTGPFQIAVQDFEDGPYLDINDTTTTLTPSALTGSITLTASSATGINDGDGFKTTDVGRLVRFQSGPPAWDVGTTYAKDDLVTGTDGNIYRSVSGANIGHDPTTDDGTNWDVDASTVIWTWLKITAWTSTTVVTATVMGDDLAAINPTSVWQLGLYSDTTGYPTCGAYHEGRLWLAGAVGNRVDSSKSNDHFNFAPTGTDGTVADDNGLSVTFNANDVNAIFWLLSTEDGLILGTQAAEWRIKASALDDPISPSSIQARRVSTYGCSNTEPVQSAGQTIFVQRQTRRILAHEQFTASSYRALNLTRDADHLTASGLRRIAWQQEPNLIIWSNTNDGTLVGCTYKNTRRDEIVNGFHRHELANQRNVTDISGGPAYDGLSDALYMITNQAHHDQPDYGVHWVQVFMPTFDAAQEDWAAYFTDGGGNPPYAQLYQTSNGDSFDGIRIFGLWPLNGLTVAPVVGGLDLGDRTVTDGYVDVPFGSDPDGVFTLAFFTALSDGTDYGIFQVDTGYVVENDPVVPPVPANSLLAYVGEDTLVDGSRTALAHLDPNNSLVYELILAPTAHVNYGGGIRKFDSDSGDELLQHDNQDIFGPPAVAPDWDIGTTYASGDFVTGSDSGYYRSNVNGNIGNDPVGDLVNWSPRASDWSIPDDISYLHADGFIYATATRGASNSTPMSKINATTLVEDSSYGSVSSSLAGSQAGRLQLAFTSMTGLSLPQSDDTTDHYLVFIGLRAASTTNEVTIIKTNPMAFVDADQIDESKASVGFGISNGTRGSFVATGQPFSSGNWPILWDSGSTYSSGVKVYGSNGQSYVSAQGSNTGHDPTTDDGTWWTVVDQFVGLYQYQFDGTTLLRRDIKKIGPKDIDSTWTTMNDMIGPAFDQSDRNIICFVETADSVTNKRYLVKFDAGDGAVIWKTAFPTSISTFATFQQMSVANVSCKMVFLYSDTAYIVDTETGALTTQATNTGFSFGSGYYDCASGSVTFFGSFSPPGSGPPMNYLGDWLPAHGDTLNQQWGRLYLGIDCCGGETITTYSIPMSLGQPYTMQGQLLRPDAGADSGTQAGPAFGKKRRIHWWGASFYRTRGVTIGVNFTDQKPIDFQSEGGTLSVAPALNSGIWSDDLHDDEGFTSQIAWQSTRPYPCNVTAMGGYIQGVDK